MSLQIELYIEGVRADLFKDETISFTSNVKDTKKIDKVLADFTQQFNLPASDVNNNIFKHYYNYDIVTGNYDARFKVDAYIKINGIGFRSGTLRLNKVEMRSGVAFSYKVVFFGKSVNLKTLIGNDKLNQLTTLDKYKHNYSSTVVKDGLEIGLGFEDISNPEPGTLVKNDSRDIIYPLISHTRQYYFDSSQKVNPTAPGFNISKVGIGNDVSEGIDYTDLKPAIKLRHIIKAIEEKYDIEFSRDFFGLPEFDKLYMWLHRNKDGIRTVGDDEQETELMFPINDFNYESGIVDYRPLYAIYEEGFPFVNAIGHTLTYTITPSTSGQYSYKLYNDISGQYELIQDENGTPTYEGFATDTVEFDASFYYGSNQPITYISPRLIITTPTGDDGIASVDINLSIDSQSKRYFNGPYESINPVPATYSINGSTSFTDVIYPTSVIPDFKVLDFLNSLFKMFNLIAYSNQNDFSDDIIKVTTLDDFYSKGETLDISEYINTDKHQVGRSIPYSYIEYTFGKPKTYLTKTRNELLSGIPFGDLNTSNSEVLFDGANYKVKVDFEHMLFERLSNLSNNTFSNVGWGWFVDESLEPAIGDPLIFINEPTNNGALAFLGTNTIVNKYNRPSNSGTVNGIQGFISTNFGVELDEFTTDATLNSLFQIYHSSYINKLFDANSRVLEIEAILPPAFLLNFNLNDVLTINNRQFTIDKIKTNLSTGKSKLTLRNLITSPVVRVNTEVDEIPEINVKVSLVNSGLFVKLKIIQVEFDESDFASTIYYVLNGVRREYTGSSPPIQFFLNQNQINNTVYITDDNVTSETITF